MEHRSSRRDQDIDEGWPERFAAEGIVQLEDYLERHHQFELYCDRRGEASALGTDDDD